MSSNNFFYVTYVIIVTMGLPAGRQARHGVSPNLTIGSPGFDPPRVHLIDYVNQCVIIIPLSLDFKSHHVRKEISSQKSAFWRIFVFHNLLPVDRQ